MKKELIDYTQKELEHIVKYNDVYKVGSYLLFACLIIVSLWAAMTEKMYKKQVEITNIQDTVFVNVLEHNFNVTKELGYYEDCDIELNK